MLGKMKFAPGFESFLGELNRKAAQRLADTMTGQGVYLAAAVGVCHHDCTYEGIMGFTDLHVWTNDEMNMESTEIISILFHGAILVEDSSSQWEVSNFYLDRSPPVENTKPSQP